MYATFSFILQRYHAMDRPPTPPVTTLHRRPYNPLTPQEETRMSSAPGPALEYRLYRELQRERDRRELVSRTGPPTPAIE